MHIMDELQENAIYFIVGFMSALVLTLVVNPLLVMIIGIFMVGGKEVFDRYRIHSNERDESKKDEQEKTDEEA